MVTVIIVSIVTGYNPARFRRFDLPPSSGRTAKGERTYSGRPVRKS